MSTKFLRISRLITPSRPATPIPSTQFVHQYRTLSSATRRMAATVDSHFISQIIQAEKLLTNKETPVQGGPAARAQSHVGNEITSQVIHDITMGERVITGLDAPVQSGPTSIAQHLLAQASDATVCGSPEQHSGILDSETISKITQKEKDITGQDDPVRAGPTARAQQHADQPISSQALHDITEGEKKVTGGERIKGGPTATAQSELGKSRS